MQRENRRVEIEVVDRHLAGAEHPDDGAELAAWLAESPEHGQVLEALRTAAGGPDVLTADMRAADWMQLSLAMANEMAPLPVVATPTPVTSRIDWVRGVMRRAGVYSPFLTVGGIVCLFTTFTSGIYIGRLSSAVAQREASNHGVSMKHQSPTAPQRGARNIGGAVRSAKDGESLWNSDFFVRASQVVHTAATYTAALVEQGVDPYRQALAQRAGMTGATP